MAELTDRRGDQVTEEGDAWNLFQRHRGKVIAVLSRCFRLSTEDIQDLTQEALVKVASSPIPSNIRSPQAWFVTAASNLAKNLFRALEIRRPFEAAMPSDPAALDVERGFWTRAASTPEDDAIRREQLRHLKAAILELPAIDRQVVLLRMQGRSYREIADILGLPSENAAKLRMSRAMARLREALAEDLEGLD